MAGLTVVSMIYCTPPTRNPSRPPSATSLLPSPPKVPPPSLSQFWEISLSSHYPAGCVAEDAWLNGLFFPNRFIRFENLSVFFGLRVVAYLDK
jgi:hypothetical protein